MSNPDLSSRNEQAATLYQNVSLTEPRLIPQLEKVIMNFIKEIKQQNSEMENLALAIKRWETHTQVHVYKHSLSIVKLQYGQPGSEL